MAFLTRHVRHVEDRHRIGAFHPHHLAARKAHQGLAGTQHRQWTFLPQAIHQKIVVIIMP